MILAQDVEEVLEAIVFGEAITAAVEKKEIHEEAGALRYQVRANKNLELRLEMAEKTMQIRD